MGSQNKNSSSVVVVEDSAVEGAAEEAVEEEEGRVDEKDPIASFVDHCIQDLWLEELGSEAEDGKRGSFREQRRDWRA